MIFEGSSTTPEAQVDSAPLEKSRDLTLQEIEDSINSLKLDGRQQESRSGLQETYTGARPDTGQTTQGDKGISQNRGVHHLDATSISKSQTPARQQSSIAQPPDLARLASTTRAVQSTLANGLSGNGLSSGARPVVVSREVDAFGLEDSLPSRTASPSTVSRRHGSFGQLCSPVEIESPPSDGAGPNDSFTQQLMAGALKLKSHLFKQERISFQDVARNPALARRARAEMDNHQFKGMIEGADGEGFEGRPHDLEVARLQVALDVVEADAEEESKINSQLSHLLCVRLEACRLAVERMLGVLQAVTAAEAAYTRALNAASKVKLVSDSDGASLKTAALRFSDIPCFVAEGHAAVQTELSETTQHCQCLVTQLRRECQSISQNSNRAHGTVLHARKALTSSFLAHCSACRAADDATLERLQSSKGASSSRLETDPWLSECRVVSAHRKLHNAQAAQRTVLATAYKTVRENEGQRCQVFTDAAHSFLSSYRKELGQDGEEEESIRGVVGMVNCEQDLAQFTASAAAAVEIGRELAERQSAALETAAQDLLCSPDIVRQGEMARFVSGSGTWADFHFILTRSGFLHWLADGQQDGMPLGSINLAKCSFEAGEAPQFNIREQQSGLFGKGKRSCFRAPSIEESCDWAIALRELIAARKVR